MKMGTENMGPGLISDYSTPHWHITTIIQTIMSLTSNTVYG